jgi:hypothetical protein
MTRAAKSDKHKHAGNSDFGAFYPTGHIVIAFKQRDEAEQVCEKLRSEGYSEEECQLHGPEEVAEAAQRNIDNERGLDGAVGEERRRSEGTPECR